MRFDLSYKGKRLHLKLDGESSAKDIRSLLHSIAAVESQVSESDLRTKVVRQLKKEIMQEGEVEEVSSPGWWEVPQELLKHKDASSFIAMESDLNQSMIYEKASFTVKTVVSENGKQFLLDREAMQHALHKLGLYESLKKTNAVLVRVKGSAVLDLKDEINDFLRKYLQVDRFHVVFEKKEYGSRASLELVLFGEFAIE